MKSHKNKIGNFFLSQKDIYLIYLIKKGNKNKRMNKSGEKVVYPKIHLQEKAQCVDKKTLNSCIISKLKNKRNTSLPLLIEPHVNSNKLIDNSISSEYKQNCFERHERRPIEFRNQKVSLYKNDFLLIQRNNGLMKERERDRDRPEFRDDLLQSELKIEQWFERKLQRKQEEKNNRKELNIINNTKDAYTERRKIHVIGIRNNDRIHKLPDSTIDKTIELEERHIPSHRLYKSLIKDKNQLLVSHSDHSDISNSERKVENNQIRKREKGNPNYSNRLSKKNSVEKSVQTINDSVLYKI